MAALKYLSMLLFVCILSRSAAEQAELPGRSFSKFKYVCNSGFSQQACHQDLQALRGIVSHYQAEGLGEWTWIIVKSQDWKAILLLRGLDPDSPSFTILEKRQTFLEEALFSAIPARQAELVRRWAIPYDLLAELAVSHELGHALCNATREDIADAAGISLRNTGNVVCGKSKPRTTIIAVQQATAH